jgi:5-(carboxyamino)imidazole ribonucleotide synthase
VKQPTAVHHEFDISIIGGGQLGRMIGLAAAQMGLKCRFYDPAAWAPASICGPIVQGDFNDEKALQAFAKDASVVTCEFENISAGHLDALKQNCFSGRVAPPAKAFRIAQDRCAEKEFFNQLGFSTASFQAVDDVEGLQQAAKALGLPAILKTRRLGYDGKGQIFIRTTADIKKMADNARTDPNCCKDMVLEGFVSFERELSLIAVRSVAGECVFYPLITNQHQNGILHLSIVDPAGEDTALQAQAEAIGKAALEALGYIGVLVIEFFLSKGRLTINEMAPRVHNSGHLTIEAAETSQFENHVRAILGWPLGSPRILFPAAMLNIVGVVPDKEKILCIPGARLHLYGKGERPGRKLGHVTLLAPDADTLQKRLLQAEQVIKKPEARAASGSLCL